MSSRSGVKFPYRNKSPEGKELAFFHMPKTAGASIRKACAQRDITVLKHDLHSEDFGSVEHFRNHHPDTYCFTFVRNPWDRIVSAFHFLSKGGITKNDKRDAEKFVAGHASFEAFVKDDLLRKEICDQIHLRPQHLWIYNKQLLVDWVGRFETLESDFKWLLKEAGLRPYRLAHTNASTHLPYQQYYTSELADIVGQVYDTDIRLFGYTFE